MFQLPSVADYVEHCLAKRFALVMMDTSVPLALLTEAVKNLLISR